MEYFYLIAGGIVLLGILYYIWGQQKGNKKSFNQHKSKLFGAAAIGMIVLIGSPMFPWSNGWFWTGEEGAAPIPGSTGYLEFNDEKPWTNTGITFDIRNRADEDGGYADTSADSITVDVFKGTSAASTAGLDDGLVHYLYDNDYISYTTWNEHMLGGYSYSVNEEALDHLFTSNYLDFEQWISVKGLTFQEQLTASSGTATSSTDYYDSEEVLTLVIGTHNAAEDGDNPLKAQMCQAVVQGEDTGDKPAALSVGTSVIDYFPSPDEDDLAIEIVDEDLADYAEATSFDWSDESDDEFEMNFNIDFTDSEFGLYSYYDYTEARWWNWYVAGYVEEDNCTTIEAATVSSNYVSGYSAASDQLNFYLQLSSPVIWKGPVDSVTETADIGYFLNSAGDTYENYKAAHYITWKLNLESCTSGGSSDNDREGAIVLDLGTGYSTTRILNAGTLLSDTDNSYNVGGTDAKTYIIT